MMLLLPTRYLRESMAAKKKASSPKKTSRSARKPSKTAKKTRAGATGSRSVGFIKEMKKIGIAIAVLAAICLSAAMVADIYFHPGDKQTLAEKLPSPSKKQKKAPSTPKRKKVQVPDQTIEIKQKKIPLKEKHLKDQKAKNIHKTPKAAKPESPKKNNPKPPVYEIYQEMDSGASSVKPAYSKKSGALPKLAVIIDDIGFDKKTALGLCDVDTRITFSVLPWSPFGKKLAKTLAARGAQIMLHLPMEPMGYPKVDPGPGALLAVMEPDVLLAQLRKDLGAIPHIVGVNNHMGSRLTASADQMNQVFTILKKEGLFFIDSRTSGKSKCASAARLLQIPFAQRDVFLDNVQNPAYISKQFAQLVKIAQKHGSAIGIGHPYKETLESLAKEIPKLSGKVELVPAKALVHVLK